MKTPVPIALAILLLGSALVDAQPDASGSQKCEALAKLNLPNVTIATATAQAAGEFAGPRHPFTGADISAFYKQLPAFCRVVAKAHPSSDSDITIEVWMPLDKWNGKLQGLANGGFRNPLRAVRAVISDDGKAVKAFPLQVTPVAPPEADSFQTEAVAVGVRILTWATGVLAGRLTADVKVTFV